MNEEDVSSDYEEEILDELCGLIFNKGKQLLKAVIKGDIDKWFSQLMISNPTEQHYHYFDDCIRKFAVVLQLYKNKGYVEQMKAEEFAKRVLSVFQYIITDTRDD